MTTTMRRLQTTGVAAAIIAIAACEGTVERVEETVDLARDVTPEMHSPNRHVTDQSFEVVWNAAIEVMEERGYDDRSYERDTRRNQYSQSTGEGMKSETVTEEEGVLTAVAGDGREIVVEVAERHEWDQSFLDLANELAGGRDAPWRFRYLGVRLTTGGGLERQVHPHENEVVFEAILRRIGEQ